MVPGPTYMATCVLTAGAVEEEVAGLQVTDRDRRRVRHLGPGVVGEADTDLAP